MKRIASRLLSVHGCGQLKNEMKEMVARPNRIRNETKVMIKQEMKEMKNECERRNEKNG